METPHPKFSSCGSKMEEGFLVDYFYNYLATNARWSPGKPEKFLLGGVYVDKEALRPIVAYKCPTCHRIELFAKEAGRR